MEAGLIGLGRMGTGIAKTLLRSGHRQTVFNRTRERADRCGRLRFENRKGYTTWFLNAELHS